MVAGAAIAPAGVDAMSRETVVNEAIMKERPGGDVGNIETPIAVMAGALVEIETLGSVDTDNEPQ